MNDKLLQYEKHQEMIEVLLDDIRTVMIYNRERLRGAPSYAGTFLSDIRRAEDTLKEALQYLTENDE